MKVGGGWMERRKDVNGDGDGDSGMVVVKRGGRGRAIWAAWLRRCAYLRYPSPGTPATHNLRSSHHHANCSTNIPRSIVVGG